MFLDEINYVWIGGVTGAHLEQFGSHELEWWWVRTSSLITEGYHPEFFLSHLLG